MNITEIKEREENFNKEVEKVFENLIETGSTDCDAFTKVCYGFIEIFDELKKLKEVDEYEDYEAQYEYVEEMLNLYFRNKLELYKLLGTVVFSKQLDLNKNSNDYYDELRMAIHSEIEEVKNSDDSLEKKKRDRESLFYLRSLLDSSTVDVMNNKLYSEKLKLSKHLASVYGGDNIATTLYSNSIQSNKIKAKLFISISPLDYMTMSENAHGWNSCHRLAGAYAQGIQSYLRDESTLVAYMSSYKQHFPLNSKKWRQVVYVALNSTRNGGPETGIIPSRHYPNDIIDAEDAVTRVLLEKFNDLSGSNGKYVKRNGYRGAVYSNGDYGHYLDLGSTNFTFYEYRNSELENNYIPNAKEVYRIGAEGICLNTGSTLYNDEQNYLCLADRY